MNRWRKLLLAGTAYLLSVAANDSVYSTRIKDADRQRVSAETPEEQAAWGRYQRAEINDFYSWKRWTPLGFSINEQRSPNHKDFDLESLQWPFP